MSHNHNTSDFTQLKDFIKELIKRGRIVEYVKRLKWDMEESHKVKYPSKTVTDRSSGENKEASKDKHLYITIIIGGTPRENLPSKGTMKRNIT